MRPNRGLRFGGNLSRELEGQHDVGFGRCQLTLKYVSIRRGLQRFQQIFLAPIQWALASTDLTLIGGITVKCS